MSHVETDLLTHCFNTHQLPIVSNSIGESANSNHYYYLNINHVTLAIANKFKPFKIINLNGKGGLMDHSGKVCQIFNHKI